MFGFPSFFREKSSINTNTNKTSDNSTIKPIMISDYIKSDSESTTAPTSMAYSASPTISMQNFSGNDKIITLPSLEIFKTKNRSVEEIYDKAIIGKCDGEFPVTNPIAENIYYNSADKKYYKCIEGSTGVVSTPDGKFFELTLFNLSNIGSTSDISITGVVAGSGVNSDGVVTISTTFSPMSSYTKGTAEAITTSDSPVTAIGKLEAMLDNKAANVHKHTVSEITNFPTSMKNPYSFNLQLNGGEALVYDGSSEKSVNITPATIGAQPAGKYASETHTHVISQIGALTGYIKPGTTSAITVSDTILTAFGKLEKALDGKQAAGNYAAADHTHNGVYAPVSHGIHVTYATVAGKAPGTAAVGTSDKVAREDHVHPLQTSVSGNAGTATKLATGRSISLTGDVTGSVTFDGSTNVSITTTVANNSHTHLWANITDKPTTFTPAAHNQASSTITAMTGYVKASAAAAITATDSLNVAIGKLEKGLEGKANSSHTHTGYLSTSGGTINGNLTVTGQILSNTDVVVSSDRRFKSNIESIKDASKKIIALNGYNYNVLGAPNSRHSGVIAQELVDVLPEAVYVDKNGYMGVKYTSIIPLLIEGFKEQQQEITKLKTMLGMEV